MDGGVDRSSSSPPHVAVAAHIRRAIGDGEAGFGERLPPARDLAAVMGVNTDTVLRALRTLREEGLLEFRHCLGVRVSGAAQQDDVATRVRELVSRAREQGYTPDDLISMIRRMR